MDLTPAPTAGLDTAGLDALVHAGVVPGYAVAVRRGEDVAVRAGGLLFCSGQIPLHPETGEIVGATAAEQAGRCLENLQAVCAAAGASLADAVAYLASQSPRAMTHELQVTPALDRWVP